MSLRLDPVRAGGGRVRRALLLLALWPSLASAQSGTLIGRVVAREGGEPLPYGIVVLPDLGREQFTDDSGAFRVGGLPPGPARLQIRRIGYAPFEATIPVRANATDSVRIVLDRVALRLATVQVTDHPPCLTPGAPSLQKDSTLAAVYQQLMLNAQQLRMLSDRYPFAYVMRQRLWSTTRNGRTVDEGTWPLPVSSKAWDYRPGQVVSYTTGGRARRTRQLEFRLPTLMELADREFIDNHCFHYGGTLVEADGPLVKVDFVAAETLREPDVHGSLFLDAETYQIRRSAMRLSKMPRSSMVRGMTALEVNVRFSEVLPSIPIMEYVSSTQRFDPSVRGVEILAANEEQVIQSFRWLKRRPGDQEKP